MDTLAYLARFQQRATLVFLLSLICLPHTDVRADTPAWTRLPTPPGAITSIAFDPNNVSNMYITIYQRERNEEYPSGLYRSEDGGTSWSFVPQPGSTDANVRVFSAPTVPTILYLADDYKGLVYRSTDDGASFIETSHGLPTSYQPGCLHELIVHPTTPTTVYVSFVRDNGLSYCSSGLYRSTDSGANWSLLSDQVSVESLAIDPVHPNILYAGLSTFLQSTTRYGGGIARSDDGGKTWKKFDDGLPPLQDIVNLLFDPRDPQTIYASTYYQKVFVSTANHPEWQSNTSGLPDDFGEGGMALVMIGSPPILLASRTNRIFWKPASSMTWQHLGDNFDERISMLATNPAIPTQLYVGTDKGLYTIVFRQTYLPLLQ